MILLDTNVISELTRPAPNPSVISWLDAQITEDVYITAVTEAELRFGVAILPAGRRRERLESEVENMLREDFERRILPFDSDAARLHAEIAASRRAMGKPISYADCQLAAIARCHGAAVATRNFGDFEHCGIDVINPWSV